MSCAMRHYQTQFRDDTLISLLRSPTSAAFLERHRTEMFANDKQLLRRVIHLLRVACVTTPTWLEPTVAQASLFNVPDGPAWACLLRLVETNLESFTATDRPLLLGFIEDWARGVSWQTPYPDGADSVAAIAHWLLPALDDYRSEEERETTLKVIAKIPNSDRERFAALLQGRRNGEEQVRAARDFQETVIEGMDGAAAARDLPQLLVSVAKDYLLLTDADLDSERWYGGGIELETTFGIRYGSGRGFFPPSGYRGPFLPLLRYHPSEGLALVEAIFNHSADWYGHGKTRNEYVESPFEATLTLSDGTLQTQWCNSRLWNLYRGTSVGPYALQSILMALERWLLDFAEAHPHELDEVLLRILRQSKSAALTAVVAGAATAFPHSAGETLLVLLRSQWCVRLDRNRLVNEMQAPSKLSGLMPQLDSGNKIFEEERKQADARPQRQHDLETAIANLQLGPLTSRVREILDQQRAAMPPVEEQDEEDRIWRLAIHRMDLRQYTIAEEAPKANVVAEDTESPKTGPQQIRLDLKPPELDVKEMVDRSAAQHQAMNAKLGLQMWGTKVFRGEESVTFDPAKWRQRLAEARTVQTDASDAYELGHGGPGYVAALCLRDHWDEMIEVERHWCVERICSELERTTDYWNQFARATLRHGRRPAMRKGGVSSPQQAAPGNAASSCAATHSWPP